MAASALFPDEAAVLRRLFTLVRTTRSQDAWSLLAGSHAPAALAATFLLLDVEEEHDVERFMRHSMARLLQHLNRRTERQHVEYRGQVRGRISWSQTYRARYAGDYAPALFVCRETHYRFDTPENQLLKALVGRIGSLLALLPASLRVGACYGPDGARPMHMRLAGIQGALQRFGRNIYLRQVAVPSRITLKHVRGAQTAELAEYRHAELLLRHVDAVLETARADELQPYARHVAGSALPLPNAEPAGEPWLHFAADVVRSEARFVGVPQNVHT